MNFNSKQEELLKLWADLVGVLSDPEGMTKMIAEANAVVNESKKYKEEVRKIKDIDDWYKGMCAELDKRGADLKAKEALLEKTVADMKVTTALQVESYDEKMADAEKKKAELNAKINEYNGLLKMRKDAERDREYLDKKEAELHAKEIDLKEKGEAVEKILGGAK